MQLVFPLIIIVVLHRQLSNLDDPVFKAKFGNLVTDLHPKKTTAVLTFTPMFFFKRLTYVAIPTLLTPYPG